MADPKPYYGLTIDPLHVGAGGYRLGRVDNTIVRDPGTNLPKIPGSSIAGVCRNYAIYGLKNGEQTKATTCATQGVKNPDWKPGEDEKKKFVDKNNCGQCVICQTFGFASGKQKKSHIGRVKFFDGQIVAFPVSSVAGPVWVTTAAILADLEAKPGQEPKDDELLLNFAPPRHGRLNLGWLYLPANKAEFSLPNEIKASPYADKINARLVLAPERLFPEIVNANLEVRTSVAIDFETGAADSGKLFTSEALPRTCLVSFEVVYDDHRCQDQAALEKVKGVVKSGLRLFETLGLGGMNTRGFGRLQVLNLD